MQKLYFELHSQNSIENFIYEVLFFPPKIILPKKNIFWRRDIFWQLRINRAEKIRKNFLLQYFGWQKTVVVIMVLRSSFSLSHALVMREETERANESESESFYLFWACNIEIQLWGIARWLYFIIFIWVLSEKEIVEKSISTIVHTQT